MAGTSSEGQQGVENDSSLQMGVYVEHLAALTDLDRGVVELYWRYAILRTCFLTSERLLRK